jgi:cytochrome b561
MQIIHRQVRTQPAITQVPKGEWIMNKGLKIVLYVIMAWLTLLGILFIFIPSAAEMVLAAPLPDRVLAMLYGQVMLNFAYVAFMAARGGEGTEKLSRAILALTVGHVIVFGYQLVSGMSGFPQAGPPLVINLIFTILLIIFRRNIKKK